MMQGCLSGRWGMVKSVMISVSALLILGCASRSPREAAFADGVLVGACPADRLPEDAEGAWREIRGGGFTYCVPPAWTHVGPRAERWTSATTDFAWGDEAFEQRRVPFVVPARGQTGATFGSRVVTETIDGATVRLEIMDGGRSSSWSAAASWLAPALRFYAIARTASASDEALAVIRSVRITKKNQ